MKVILSVEPVCYPLTGIGRYTYELAGALRSGQHPDTLLFFTGAKLVRELPEPNARSDNRHWLKRVVQASPFALEVYRRTVPLIRKGRLRDFGDFIYHGPNFFIPPFPGKAVATFHDLSPFTWPGCHGDRKARFLRSEIESAVGRADFLITPSNATRDEVIRHFGFPSGRVATVPLAASGDFRPRRRDEVSECLKRFGLSYGGYTLFVGTMEPRKNICSLIDAYRMLPISVRRRFPLVLAGYKGWENEEIFRRIATARREGWLSYLGFLPAGDLPLLFSGAHLFVFPSLYEGFGLPVLEAMQSGVPVVCSNSSSLPEVARDSALMSDPFDAGSLAENILRGLEDQAWRAEAIDKGLRYAGEFSWVRCASETRKIYHRVASGE